MTHVAWVPPRWLDAAERTLEGMAERHPSRTVILVPRPEEEESRIDAVNRGEYSVGNHDLVRIFDLKTPPPPLAETQVEHFSGLQRARTTRYNADGTLLASVDERHARPAQAPGAAGSTINGFRFKCPTCDKKKKKGT